jgi:proteasome lid subunit RPN8/RPN11
LGKDVDNSVVKIKPLAYYKMVLHVLRFGNKARINSQCIEVMGVLIGHHEESEDKKFKNVIIEDSVPISHGSSVEVEFSINDYIFFEKANSMYLEKNWFMVGWYHSHPNLFQHKIFFSPTDVKNQFGWQNELNPSGIALVFDHAYLESPDDPGFRAIRLTNPTNIRDSSVHQVKAIVEPPNDLNYYLKLVELINCVYSNEPPIIEENETADIFGDVQVPELSQLRFKQPEIDSHKIVESVQVGLANFLDLSLTPLINYLNSIAKNISGEIENNNVEIRDNLSQLKNLVNTGINKIQRKYKDDLNSELFNAEGYVDDFLDQIDVYHDEIGEILKDIEEFVQKKLDISFKEKFEVLKNDFSKDYDEWNSKIMNLNGNLTRNLGNLEKLENSLITLSDKINSIKDATLEKIKKMQKETSDITSKKHGIMKNSISDLQKNSKKFVTNLKAAVLILEGTKGPIFEKIEKLESEKKELLLKIKELEQGGNE